MANTYINRNFSNSGNRTIWTLSMWVKRSKIGAEQMLAHAYQGSNDYTKIRFESDDILTFENYTGGSRNIAKRTNRMFRDTNAFYHFVFVNTPSAQTIYVNGVQETSWRTNTTGNVSTWWNHNISNTMFATVNGGSNYFDGIASHVHFCDGTALAPTVFGETDSTTGEWKIKTAPSFTLGTNGFIILKDGNTITDQSANSNNFSLGGGTLTNTKDCPSNVMATMNPLAKFKSGAGITQGNNTVTMTTAKAGVMSTIGIPNNKGKFYAEFKMTRLAADSRFHFGILPFECLEADDPVNAANKGIMLSGYNAAIYAGGGNINAFYGGTGRFNSFTGILGIAVDLTSSTKTIAFSKDGAWITGSNATNANYSNALKVNITSYLSISPHWHIGVGSGNSSGTTGIYTMNFGNGFFGTTAITTNSGNGYAGAEGASKFAYQPRSGHSALSTKGLNQ